MKVEFLDDELNGLELVILGSEFLKAKDDDLELKSFARAVEGYCNLFCIGCDMEREDYNEIVKHVKKLSLVIFVVKNDENLDNPVWGDLRVYVSFNNQNRRVY